MRFSGLSMSVPYQQGAVKGGAHTRICTSAAPALRSWAMIRLLVVPRTMLSSINTTRFPVTTELMGLSFKSTPASRSSCVGAIKVRPIYLFLVKPIA